MSNQSWYQSINISCSKNANVIYFSKNMSLYYTKKLLYYFNILFYNTPYITFSILLLQHIVDVHFWQRAQQ